MFTDYLEEEAGMFEIEWREGYAAYLEWQSYGGTKPHNPYDEDAQPVEYASWKKGFQQALEDS